MDIDLGPFHDGERHVQERAGQTREADQNSPMIASRIPAGAIPFVRQQSLFVLALLSKDELWCVPLLGKPGWMSVPMPNELRMDLGMKLAAIDPRVLSAAEATQQVGGVVLDFTTRRRLRVNGRLSKDTECSLALSVAEAYPNCPKYITRRSVRWTAAREASQVFEGTVLSEHQQNGFRKADGFFIASQHPTRGLDASHRGGNPGFVECLSPETLRFADFVGNGLFNTLGNLEIDSRVGMLLPDFSGGRAIEVTGTAKVIYGATPDSRMVEVHVERWRETDLSGVEAERELSPFNP